MIPFSSKVTFFFNRTEALNSERLGINIYQMGHNLQVAFNLLSIRDGLESVKCLKIVLRTIWSNSSRTGASVLLILGSDD